MLYLPPERRKKKGREQLCRPELFERLHLDSSAPLLREYYAKGTAPADSPISTVPLVALDLETTGLNPQKDAIVSLGLIPLDIHRIQCGQARYWVVNPGGELSSRSVVIHGITHAEIADSPDFMQIIPPLLQIISGAVLVVHCREIEQQFLDAAFRQRLGEGIVFPVIDTMEIESRHRRGGIVDLLARFMGRSRPSLRLAASRARYHLPPYAPHHALTDALATAELFQAQIAWHYSAHTPLGQLSC